MIVMCKKVHHLNGICVLDHWLYFLNLTVISFQKNRQRFSSANADSAHARHIKQAIHRVVFVIFLLPEKTGELRYFFKVSWFCSISSITSELRPAIHPEACFCIPKICKSAPLKIRIWATATLSKQRQVVYKLYYSSTITCSTTIVV